MYIHFFRDKSNNINSFTRTGLFNEMIICSFSQILYTYVD